jgi:hypothetical protein
MANARGDGHAGPVRIAMPSRMKDFPYIACSQMEVQSHSFLSSKKKFRFELCEG